MKKALVAASALCVALASIGAVCAATPIRVKVPFAFHAGETILPPGEYRFEMRSNLTIRASNGTEVFFVPVSTHEVGTRILDNAVTFTKYEDTYFLTKVNMYGDRITMTKTRLERKMAQSNSKPSTVAEQGQR